MVEVGVTDLDGRGALARVVSHRAFLLVVAFLLGAAVTVVVPRLVGTGDPGLEIGESFAAPVVSYFDDSGPEPNVICFDREGDRCGRPLFAGDVAPDVQPGDQVRATEIWLRDDQGIKWLAFFVEPEAVAEAGGSEVRPDGEVDAARD